MEEGILFRPIGIIHTPFQEPAGMPIQPTGGKEIEGTVEIFPEFADGLLDMDGFSRIILIYHFHRSGPCRLHLIPFLDTRPHGVFATRAPNRPNPLGISIVSLIACKDTSLHIRGVDMLDNTPLLDIKPYLPECDAFCEERTGWFPQGESRFSATLSDDRFTGHERIN